jgi:hypothetical protein
VCVCVCVCVGVVEYVRQYLVAWTLRLIFEIHVY